jgi:hypothetical protein
MRFVSLTASKISSPDAPANLTIWVENGARNPVYWPPARGSRFKGRRR